MTSFFSVKFALNTKDRISQQLQLPSLYDVLVLEGGRRRGKARKIMITFLSSKPGQETRSSSLHYGAGLPTASFPPSSFSLERPRHEPRKEQREKEGSTSFSKRKAEVVGASRAGTGEQGRGEDFSLSSQP